MDVFQSSISSSGKYVSSEPGGGCHSCSCNIYGTARGTVCDSQSSQCQCTVGNSGVGGVRCDSCVLEYFGFSRGQ